MAFKVTPPNYTQIPNDLIDEWLPKLGPVETKVLLVIMRKTFGWHKVRDRISLSQLEKLTGSHRPSILKAISSLQEKKLVTKEVIGKNGEMQTFYELFIEDSNNSYPFSKHTPPSSLKEPTKERDLISKEIRSPRQASGGRAAKAAGPAKADRAAPPPLMGVEAAKVAEKFCDLYVAHYNQNPFPNRDAAHVAFQMTLAMKKIALEEMLSLVDFAFQDDFWVNQIRNYESFLKNLDKIRLRKNQQDKKKRNAANRELAKRLEDKLLNMDDPECWEIGKKMQIGSTYVKNAENGKRVTYFQDYDSFKTNLLECFRVYEQD